MAAPASPRAPLHSPVHLPVDERTRYRLHVVTTNIAHVVTSIGGLIFDHAMAGWDVTVAADGDRSGRIDDRPIRILGARLASAADRPGSEPHPQVLAVATDMFVANEPIRRLALAARKSKTTDVLLWGRRHPPKCSRRLVPARHHPSAAAHVFKSHALAGRAASAAQPADEGLYSMS